MKHPWINGVRRFESSFTNDYSLWDANRVLPFLGFHRKPKRAHVVTTPKNLRRPEDTQAHVPQIPLGLCFVHPDLVAH